MRRETTKEALEVLTEADQDQIRKAIHRARMRIRPPLPRELQPVPSLEKWEGKYNCALWAAICSHGVAAIWGFRNYSWAAMWNPFCGRSL